MKWIGLTGGIASGKSVAANFLRQMGLCVADADYWARLALDEGREPYRKVVEAWGAKVLLGDGRIDRPQLGRMIFSDPDKKESLESWIHPFVRESVSHLRDQWRRQGQLWAVYDVPLLFEQDMAELFDHVLLIHCSPETQIARLELRNQFDRNTAEARLAAQIPIDDKIPLADAVIKNEGSLQELDQQLALWKSARDVEYS